ncbi:transporter substrate-binding domain-containing protein [Advenella mimigardefordensis]|uniref:Putative ABC transporter periplasmic substrate-binding protein n=1 Tax=Advenella mimigardefordensis (strain DSM 17166 / LMG 22922 / DPN7) TaxID=1247726 RepID=W0PKC1_ADVMD|nr:transporter substrate-binding domain-containing protein [Advenella mimigardefordensis]AHG65443.1 putative ABC transporter periplasmic substrate-binding protein [Advenella mimigardefordensis DPN7]
MTYRIKPVLLAFSIMGAICGGLPLASANTLEQVMEQKLLRVAIDLNAPPYGMTDDKMTAIGSDVETANLIADSLGVKLQIVPTTQANRIPFLLTNKADVVISSLSITEERARVVDFTIPYADNKAVIAVSKDSPVKELKDLVGKTVVTARGTTNDQQVTKQAPPGTNIVRFENDATAITAITSGQSSIFATAPSIIGALNQKYPAKAMDIRIVMSSAKLAIGVAKNNPEIKEKMNELIRANLKNGKLNEIYKKYHQTDLPADVVALGG